jgi:hypothetical protein
MISGCRASTAAPQAEAAAPNAVRITGWKRDGTSGRRDRVPLIVAIGARTPSPVTAVSSSSKVCGSFSELTMWLKPLECAHGACA